ncbi:heat shock cognate 70 kda protein 2, partial [Nicotiana attenuata]
VKRFIGRRFSNAYVQGDMKLRPIKIIPIPGDNLMIVVNYKSEEEQFDAEKSLLHLRC